jgi:virulence-associated protein VagC
MLLHCIYMNTIIAKVFKAGNSKALRLPSSLGVAAGTYEAAPETRLVVMTPMTIHQVTRAQALRIPA